MRAYGRGNLHYAVFDVLWLNGNDLRGRDLASRKRALNRVIKQTSTVLSQVFSVRGRGRIFWQWSSRWISKASWLSD